MTICIAILFDRNVNVAKMDKVLTCGSLWAKWLDERLESVNGKTLAMHSSSTFLWIWNVKLICTLCASAQAFSFATQKSGNSDGGQMSSTVCVLFALLFLSKQNGYFSMDLFWQNPICRRYVGEMLLVFAYLLFDCAIQKPFEILSFCGSINGFASVTAIGMQMNAKSFHEIRMFSFAWFHCGLPNKMTLAIDTQKLDISSFTISPLCININIIAGWIDIFEWINLFTADVFR